jgi:aryl-alcohol dehydrogenase-like predicted oxidoreductase
MPLMRALGRTGLQVSAIGFGAFKIGRNQGIKYAAAYELPDERSVAQLLVGLVDAGINYFDTAPAYGLSEERLGQLLPRRPELVISTKVGEEFADNRSRYDFSAAAVRTSLERSLRRLRRDRLDLVFVHAPGNDVEVLEQSDVVATLQEAQRAGWVRSIGFSGKTVAGARLALAWADVLMVEYHPDDRSHAELIAEAAQRGVGIVVKKGLASGRLEAAAAIPWVLATPGVTSLVIGSLSLARMSENLRSAAHP